MKITTAMLKLSILIPVYNGENYIGRCLDSLKHQNLDANEFEILILNDGSTDGSLSVIEKYLDAFLNIYVFSEPNSGSDISRNKLLDKAKGTYIYFLDADDYLVSNALPQVLNLGITKNLDIVGFQSEPTHKSDDFQSNLQSFDFDNVAIINGLEFVNQHPKFRQEVWWYITSKEYIDRYQIRFNEKKGQSTGDWVFTNECVLQADRIVILNIIFHRYYQSQDSVMRSQEAKKVELLINNLYHAILSFDQFCDKLKSQNKNLNPEIFAYLDKRKGTMINFFLHKMYLENIDVKTLEEYLKLLKERNLYPTKRNLGSDGFKSWIMRLVLKRERLFLLIYKLTVRR